MKGGDISTHRNGLLMGDSSAVFNTSIRYAVIAEEWLRFNHVIESAVTQKGMRGFCDELRGEGQKIAVFHPHITSLVTLSVRFHLDLQSLSSIHSSFVQIFPAYIRMHISNFYMISWY